MTLVPNMTGPYAGFAVAATATRAGSECSKGFFVIASRLSPVYLSHAVILGPPWSRTPSGRPD